MPIDRSTRTNGREARAYASAAKTADPLPTSRKGPSPLLSARSVGGSAPPMRPTCGGCTTSSRRPGRTPRPERHTWRPEPQGKAPNGPVSTPSGPTGWDAGGLLSSDHRLWSGRLPAATSSRGPRRSRGTAAWKVTGGICGLADDRSSKPRLPAHSAMGGCLGPVASGRVVEQGHSPHHETTERTDPQQRAQHPERRDKGSAAPSQ